MSDEPQGPGWWIASDGKWYPPELHPSVRQDDPQPAAVPEAATGPQSTVTAGSSPAPQRWQGQGASPAQDDQAPKIGPQFPDLFQKALQGSHLADNVSVKYSGDDPRSSVDPAPRAPSASVGSDSSSGAVGSFSGATATKRRWRRGH